MVMLGLGGSVGTPAEGITAEVVVVADEAGLEALGERARGRIALFNNAMPPYDPETGSGYGTAVRFRSNGARLAAAQGAVACLVRSVTASSLCTPHTGAMRYGDAAVKIPAAAVTIEDAELMARLTARGETVRVRLNMEARTLEDAPSGNVIGELRGRERPDEIVVIGGHIDAWDVGQGAHDDGAGCVMAMESLRLLRELGMVPRRTIRVVLWTNEENGLAGARAYAADHAAELPRHVAAIESDSGAFAPVGLSVECADAQRQAGAVAHLTQLAELLEPLGASSVETGFSGADLGPMRDAGVVLMGHRVEGSIYFNYHHSPADTLDKVDPDDLARNVAVMAITAYVLADMEERLGDAVAAR
jgi:Zn-dependent M28 family amino/carboxypeptidase